MKVGSTTVMLIVISILFLIFSIPIDIYFLGYAYGAFSDVTPEEGAIRWLFYAFVTLLYYTNNSLPVSVPVPAKALARKNILCRVGRSTLTLCKVEASIIKG